MEARPAGTQDLPPCEDKKATSSNADGDAYTERNVLAAHCDFRRRVKLLVAAMALIPILIFPVSWGGTSALVAAGISPGQAIWLALAFTGLAATTLISLNWLTGVHLVERRFTNIRRHSLVAAEGVSVDSKENALESIDMLMRTWSYYQFLYRWLQDVRFTVFVYCAGLLSLIGAALFLGRSLPFMEWAGTGAFAALMVANVVVPGSFAMKLVREAKRHSTVPPIGGITARMDALITEVKDLRRGPRVRAN